jgi:cytochrome bd ubiquinol oxidase subunit II
VPLRLAALLFLLGFAGLAVSLWPYIVPYRVTIWAGAADTHSRSFAGVGAIVTIPIILAYQFRAYWVFRGKTIAAQPTEEEAPALHARRTSSQTPGLHLS